MTKQYNDQLNKKVNGFIESLLNIGIDKSITDKISVFPSKEINYRMRAEFRIWHEGDDIFYAMHKPDTKEIYTLTDFPAASEQINVAMPKLLEHIKRNELLRRKLFQVEFLSSLKGELLISMIYHKPLNEDWDDEAKKLEQILNASIIGRARKQKRVITKDFVMESLNVFGKEFEYQQVENSFTQPNAEVCIKMLEWTISQVKKIDTNKRDLLELYCGNGNFTLPLAQYYRRVLATEVSKTSVRSALFNADLNQVDNLSIARLSSEEVVQALDKFRAFRRLKDIDLDSYDFNTLFLDPPRAGLDEDTLRLASRFNNIIYISCNPNTLLDNLQSLKQHTVCSIAAFDQFPFTHHLEVGAILKKR